MTTEKHRVVSRPHFASEHICNYPFQNHLSGFSFRQIRVFPDVKIIALLGLPNSCKAIWLMAGLR